MNTIFYITTLGRTKQPTLEALPPLIRSDVRLVVQAHEKDLVRTDIKKIVLPKHIKTLNTTREFLFKNTDKEKMFLLDDDMVFYKRKSPEDWHLVKSSPTDIVNMFHMLENWLDEYSHVSVSAREGNNRVEGPFKLCGRALRCLGYRTKDVAQLDDIGRMLCMSDFDITLRLLRLGLANKISYNYAQNHSSSNAPGGCSLYRTKEKLAQAAIQLQKFHEPFVKLVEKETKGAWGGGTRTDVQIQWKKAYMSGLPDMLK